MDNSSALNTELLIDATQLAPGELARFLGLSASGFQRRKRDDRFSRAQRTKLVRIVHVLERAQRVLGDRARGLEWLRHSNRALNFTAPLALLETKAGTLRVFSVLLQIEGGAFANSG